MQVSRLVAKGGGDLPEDVLPALDAAAKLSWAARARFALLITDAPCHGRDYNDCPDDKYPNVRGVLRQRQRGRLVGLSLIHI